jgi:hypothetical protein
MAESAMALSRGKFLGYNFDLQIIEFTMFDGSTGVRCAVETAAMDELEQPRTPTIRSASDLVPARKRQFERLRDHVEQSASSRFAAGALENDGTVLVRREDLHR